jgi:hypothetical protein
LGIGIFGAQVQRRGTGVNTPKIGSRVGVKCFGGIQRFCAELRRELSWGNWDLSFFGVLFGCPRSSTEEGGLSVFFGGILNGATGCGWLELGHNTRKEGFA